MRAPTDKRLAGARLKVFQPATVQVGTDAVRVHLLDLTASGALVHGLSDALPGNQLALACCGWTRAASVAWTTNKRLGVRFVEPLSEGDVAAAIRIGSAPSPTV